MLICEAASGGDIALFVCKLVLLGFHFYRAIIFCAYVWGQIELPHVQVFHEDTMQI
jgi:hypothetical protein